MMVSKNEIEAVRTGVGIYEARDQGHLQVEGPEVGPFLQRIVTNDVMVPVGTGCHAAILDRKGMVRSLFSLTRVAGNTYHIVTPPQLKEKTFDILVKLKLREPIEIRDVSGEWRLMQLIGPGAEEALTSGGWRPVVPLRPSFSDAARGDAGRQDPPQGETLVWKDNFYRSPVWNILYSSAAGPGSGSAQPYSELSVRPGARPSPPAAEIPTISKEAFDLLRMESGIPEYGADIDETHILLEANLPHTYKRQKGCYPGQEVIERILAYGKGRTPRTLCALYMEGDHKILPKAEIFTESGERAGQVTSSLYNPLDQRTVILGYLDHKYSEGVHEIRESASQFILVR